MSKRRLTDMQTVAVDQMVDLIVRLQFALKEAKESIKELKDGAVTFDIFCESNEYQHLSSLCEEFCQTGESFTELEYDEELDDPD